MRPKLGVLMVGMGGGIATTVTGGVFLMRKNLANRIGMLTETGRIRVKDKLVLIQEHLGLDTLDDIVFGGWDITPVDLFQAALSAKIIRREMLNHIQEEMASLRPVRAVFSSQSVKNIEGENIHRTQNLFDSAELIRQQIRDFRRSLGTDRLVVVNIASTERALGDDGVRVLQDPVAFENGLKENHPAITPAMIYFYAAIQEGLPHVNFTPSLAEVPALRRLAADHKILYCGKDGKTGQTLLKTVLAPAFKGRQLKVDGWFSTNILGNKDGKVLSDPESLQAKLKTKASVLDEILGYKVGEHYDVPSHLVSIHYYPPRGDAKEAWDSIDIVGFLNTKMQIKVNFLCRDSILAAPLVLDLARFSRHAADHGQSGIFRAMSVYFKSPLHSREERQVHDFFQQQLLLGEYILGGRRSHDPFFELW